MMTWKQANDHRKEVGASGKELAKAVGKTPGGLHGVIYNYPTRQLTAEEEEGVLSLKPSTESTDNPRVSAAKKAWATRNARVSGAKRGPRSKSSPITNKSPESIASLVVSLTKRKQDLEAELARTNQLLDSAVQTLEEFVDSARIALNRAPSAQQHPAHQQSHTESQPAHVN